MVKKIVILTTCIDEIHIGECHMKRSWFKVCFVYTLCMIYLCLSACQEIPPDNPYDPQAPDLVQAPGQVLGELFTSEPGGSLRGAVVYLSGSSQSAVVECLDDMGHPEVEEGMGLCQRARFSFGAVPPGAYDVRLSAPCFSAQAFANFEVGIGEVIDLSRSSMLGIDSSLQDGMDQNTPIHQAILVRYARGLVRGQVTGVDPQRFSEVSISDARGALAVPNEMGDFQIEMASCEGQLQASLIGYRSASSSTLNVPVAAEIELTEPLYLEPIPAILVGTLLTSTGEALPEEGVTLTLERASSSATENVIQHIMNSEIELGDLPTGAWHLRIEHPSYQRIEQRIELSAALRGREDAYELGTLRLLPAMGTLSGQVSLEGSDTEVPIYVELLDGPSAGIQQQTSRSGFYQFNLIRGGAYRVSARAYGFLTTESEEETLVLGEESSTAPEVRLALDPGQVRGVVVRPLGLEEISLSVSLGSEVTQTQDDVSCIEGIDCLEGARCEVGGCLQPLGFFQFERVPAGEYSLNIQPLNDHRLRTQSRSNIRVEPGEVFTLEAIRLERSMGQISGRIRLLDLTEDEAQSSSGFAEARVYLRGEEGQPLSTEIDMQNGNFEFVDVPVHSYLFSVNHPDYFASEQPVALTTDGEQLDLGLIDLTIHPATVGGVIRDEAFIPIPRVGVSVGEAYTETDENGAFTVTGIRAGRYTLALSADGYEHLLIEGLDVSAGEERILNSLTLLYATGSLHGQVSLEGDGSRSVLIQLEHLESGDELITLSDLSGTWHASNLRVGHYRVTMSAPDYQTEVQTIEVLEAQTLTLDQALLYDRGCVRGRVEMTDGSMAYDDVTITLVETVSATFGDAQGRFQFDDLIPGTYTINAERDGYRSASVVFTIIAGQVCSSPSIELILYDQQAPSTPLFEFAEDYDYVPLANASQNPAILKAEWNEEGRFLVQFVLNETESSPFDDVNFDPFNGLGQWLVKMNDGGFVSVPQRRSQTDHFWIERTADQVIVSLELPVFDVLPAQSIAHSVWIQEGFGQSAAELQQNLGSDAEIITALEAALDPRGSLGWWERLSSIPTPDYEVQFKVVDSMGNTSSMTSISFRFDLSFPLNGALLIPDECNPTPQKALIGDWSFERCHTNRETLNLRLASTSTELACAYVVELTESEVQGIDFRNLHEQALDQMIPNLSLTDDCLSPNVSHLISTGEQADGERLYCLFSVDYAGRTSISTKPNGGAEDFCISVLRDVTAPERFSVAPDQAYVRGKTIHMNIQQSTVDTTLSHYEIRNLTTGSDLVEILPSDRESFQSPVLAAGLLNELEVKAVDLAGNRSEVVYVSLWENSIQALDDEGESAVKMSSFGSQRLWLRPTSCDLDGEGAELGGFVGYGRGCHASLLVKNGQDSSSEPLFHPPLSIEKLYENGYTFGNTAPPLEIKIDPTGDIERVILRARFLFDDDAYNFSFEDEAEIILSIPNQPDFIVSSANLLRTTVYNVRGEYRVFLTLDTEQDEALADVLKGLNAYGTWKLNVVFPNHLSTTVDLDFLELNLTLAEEEITRCVIACGEVDDEHTGEGLSDFQLHLSAGGLLLTQYAEVQVPEGETSEYGKVHQVRYWGAGDDEKLGTVDDYEILLNDHPNDASMPILALTGSHNRLAFARADATNSGFTVHAFIPHADVELGKSRLYDWSLLRHSESFENARLKSLSLTDRLLWVTYTNLTLNRDVLKVIYLPFEDETLSIPAQQDVHFGAQNSNVIPKRIIESNGDLLFLLEVNQKHHIKRFLQSNRIVKVFKGDESVTSDCRCTSTLCPCDETLCLNEVCFDFELASYQFEISEESNTFTCLDEPTIDQCKVSFNASLASWDSFGSQLLFQTYCQAAKPYRVYKTPLVRCPTYISTFFHDSRERLESVEINQERVTMISHDRSMSGPIEIQTNTQMMAQKSIDQTVLHQTRHHLKASNLGFLEQRGEGVNAQLYLSRKDFGAQAQVLALPDRRVFGNQQEYAVIPDDSWHNGKGYALITNEGNQITDRIYVVVRAKDREERILLSANLFGQINSSLDWRDVAYFSNTVDEIRAIYVMNNRYFVVVASDDRTLQGPLMIYDTGAGNPIGTPLTWTYSDLGITESAQLPQNPCHRVALAENERADSERVYLVGCASQQNHSTIDLHLAEISFGLNYDLPEVSKQYIAPDLTSFPTVYKLENLQFNRQSDLFLELKDDQVGRMYLSSKADRGRVYEPFSQVYARQSNDQSEPIFTEDSLIFTDERQTQEPEIIKLSIFDMLIERLSLDPSPQYSPVLNGNTIYWFDERYINSDGEALGAVITSQQSL